MPQLDGRVALLASDGYRTEVPCEIACKFPRVQELAQQVLREHADAFRDRPPEVHVPVADGPQLRTIVSVARQPTRALQFEALADLPDEEVAALAAALDFVGYDDGIALVFERLSHAVVGLSASQLRALFGVENDLPPEEARKAETEEAFLTSYG